MHHYNSTQCCNTETVFINIPLPPDQHHISDVANDKDLSLRQRQRSTCSRPRNYCSRKHSHVFIGRTSLLAPKEIGLFGIITVRGLQRDRVLLDVLEAPVASNMEVEIGLYFHSTN